MDAPHVRPPHVLQAQARPTRLRLKLQPNSRSQLRCASTARRQQYWCCGMPTHHRCNMTSAC